MQTQTSKTEMCMNHTPNDVVVINKDYINSYMTLYNRHNLKKVCFYLDEWNGDYKQMVNDINMFKNHLGITDMTFTRTCNYEKCEHHYVHYGYIDFVDIQLPSSLKNLYVNEVNSKNVVLYILSSNLENICLHNTISKCDILVNSVPENLLNLVINNYNGYVIINSLSNKLENLIINNLNKKFVVDSNVIVPRLPSSLLNVYINTNMFDHAFIDLSPNIKSCVIVGKHITELSKLYSKYKDTFTCEFIANYIVPCTDESCSRLDIIGNQ